MNMAVAAWQNHHFIARSKLWIYVSDLIGYRDTLPHWYCRGVRLPAI